MAGTLTIPSHAARYGHQADDIARLRTALGPAGARVLYVAFMGSGKTVVATELIAEWVAGGARVLVLVHRRVLMVQTDRRLRAILSEADVGWIWGKHPRRRDEAPVQLASIDTLVRREMPPGITHVVIDEAHHAAAGKWRKVIEWAAPGTRILGLTATPERLDGKPLGDFFDTMIEAPGIEDLIAAGTVQRPEVWTRTDFVLPDMTHAVKRQGDWTETACASAMSTIIGKIPEHYLKVGEGRPAVGFCAMVSECRRLKRLCAKYGIRSEVLTGETSEIERRGILARLAKGQTKIVWTCDALSEGWDFPGARCVILARPTLSITKYLQWCGRAMRAGDVKPVILDHAGCFHWLGLPDDPRTWNLHARRGATPAYVKVEQDGRVVVMSPEEIQGELAKVAVGARPVRDHRLVLTCRACGSEFAGPKARPERIRLRRQQKLCETCRSAPCVVCGHPSTRGAARRVLDPKRAYCRAHQPSGRGVERPTPACIVCGGPPPSPARARYALAHGKPVYCRAHRGGPRVQSRMCEVCGVPCTGKRWCSKHRHTERTKVPLPCVLCGEPSNRTWVRARSRPYCDVHRGGTGLGQVGRWTPEQRAQARVKQLAKWTHEKRSAAGRKAAETKKRRAGEMR